MKGRGGSSLAVQDYLSSISDGQGGQGVYYALGRTRKMKLPKYFAGVIYFLVRLPTFTFYAGKDKACDVLSKVNVK